MAFDEGLAQRIRELLVEEAALVEKKMFGGVGFMLNGNMAVGVSGDELMVRVGPEGYETALEEANTRPFDMTGRPMKGWILVSAEGIEEDQALRRWIDRGRKMAKSLPPK